MFRGKETCKILKQIRQNIASENDIPLVVVECHYKGECRGTCPRCEAELEYLEKELLKRRSMGKKIVLAGLSAGLSWTPMVAAEEAQSNATIKQDTLSSEEYPKPAATEMLSDSVSGFGIYPIKITGKVTDSNGEPAYAVAVIVKGTTRGVPTDYEGKYTIYVNPDEVLEFSGLGYKKVERRVDKAIRLDVKMQDDTELDDNVIVEVGNIREVTLEEATERVRGLKVPENGAELMPRPLIRLDEYHNKGLRKNIILQDKVYPMVKEMNQEVKVKVRFVIGVDGSLSDFRVVSTDDERFNEAAMETIKRMDGWRWYCREVNGKLVKTKKTVIVHYTKEELMRVMEQEEK